MGYYGRSPLGEVIYTDRRTERPASADAASRSGGLLFSADFSSLGDTAASWLRQWNFLGKGAYNYAYRDHDTGSLVLKIPKDQVLGGQPASIRYWLHVSHYGRSGNRIELSAAQGRPDSPSRLMRIAEDVESVNNFKIEGYMVDVIDRDRGMDAPISLLATVSPFISGPYASDFKRAILLLKIYDQTGRVVTDAPSADNIIWDHKANQPKCVDLGLAKRRGSVVSEEVWEHIKEEFQNVYWPSYSVRGRKPLTVWVCRWLMAIEFENEQVNALPELGCDYPKLLSSNRIKIIYIIYNRLTNKDRIKMGAVLDLIGGFGCPLETLAFCLQYASAAATREICSYDVPSSIARQVKGYRDDLFVTLVDTYYVLTSGEIDMGSAVRLLLNLLSNSEHYYSRTIPSYNRAIKPIIDISKQRVRYLEHNQDDNRSDSGCSSESPLSAEFVALALAAGDLAPPASPPTPITPLRSTATHVSSITSVGSVSSDDSAMHEVHEDHDDNAPQEKIDIQHIFLGGASALSYYHHCLEDNGHDGPSC